MPSRQKSFGIIWDVDGTLYRDDTPEMDCAFESAGAQAAIDCGVPLSFADAKQFAHDAYETGKSYLEAFVEEYGINGHEYHFRYHAQIDLGRVCVSKDLRDQFRRIGVSNNVIVTHGARNWVERIIPHLGLEDFFPGDRIVTLEDGHFNKKSESPVMFRLGMEKLGLPADCIVVVENSAANLRVPFDMGMKTMLIDYGTPLTPKPNYVTLRSGSISEALDTLARISNGDRAGLFLNQSTRSSLAPEPL